MTSTDGLQRWAETPPPLQPIELTVFPIHGPTPRLSEGAETPVLGWPRWRESLGTLPSDHGHDPQCEAEPVREGDTAVVALVRVLCCCPWRAARRPQEEPRDDRG